MLSPIWNKVNEHKKTKRLTNENKLVETKGKGGEGQGMRGLRWLVVKDVCNTGDAEAGSIAVSPMVSTGFVFPD